MPPKNTQGNAKKGGSAAKAAAKLPHGYSQPGQHAPPQQAGESGGGAGNAFMPPGACNSSRQRRNTFGNEFEKHFHVPQRLANVPTPLVEAVNDFHFAMMNDTPRNEFYYELLKRNIVPGETTVLEIGAGSGVLSMMAAQLGAKWVVAIEGSDDMCELARRNVAANGFKEKVTVLSMMSTELEVDDLPSRPDVLVSEIFGTLMLGESAHEYIEDIRKRVLKPGGRVIPQHGVQYAVPIECPTLESICSVSSWNGLDLRHVTAVQDTASVVFTKKYGFRMSSVEYTPLSAPIAVVSLDFAKSKAKDIPKKQQFTIEATKSGTAHAMMLYWVVKDDGLVMSTDPQDTLGNFPRDMQWGQALQLLDGGAAFLPTKVALEAGVKAKVASVTSNDGVLLQFTVTPYASASKTTVVSADGDAEGDDEEIDEDAEALCA